MEEGHVIGMMAVLMKVTGRRVKFKDMEHLNIAIIELTQVSGSMILIMD